MTEWTVETLRELMQEYDRRYETRFDGQEKAVNAALIAAKEAVSKAEVAAEKRFDSVNEFRGQLNDQAQTFMPRLEAEQRLSQLTERIADMNSRLDGSYSSHRVNLVATLSVIVAIVAVVAGIATAVAVR